MKTLICFVFVSIACLLGGLANAGGPGKPPPPCIPVVTPGDTGIVTFNGPTASVPDKGPCYDNPLGGAYPVIVNMGCGQYTGTQIHFETCNPNVTSTNINLPSGVIVVTPLNVTVTGVDSEGKPFQMTGTITGDACSGYTITWDPLCT